MPWGDAAWTAVIYPHPLSVALEHARHSLSAFAVTEGEDHLGIADELGGDVTRIRAHFRYGLKRFGQKTRVHVYVVGDEREPQSLIGVESQGGDIHGTASRAGRERFLEQLANRADFEVWEEAQGPPIWRS